LKSRILLPLFFLFSAVSLLSALGKKEQPERKSQNDEWILCVTDFDVSAVPAEKLTVASAITRSFVEKLKVIDHRVRVSPEYAYYEGQAWAKARAAAAKALSSKQNDRALLLYRGEPEWKYKQNVAKINTDIEKLKTDLENIEKEAPLINKEPVFNLTKGNLDLSFPQAPKEGTENKFCLGQKADAFIAGSIMDFHGRYSVSIKLYTVFTGSFTYEDSIIFSPDDFDSAVDEIAGRLILALSGSRTAALSVKAEPEETLVLINRSFAGRGETELLEYPPGKVTITASAPDYESLTVETELVSGELTEINLRLKPLDYGNVVIGERSAAGRVYQGALYVGESPYTLRLPLDLLDYIELETPNKDIGKAVFHGPDLPDSTYSLSVKTGKPQPGGRVDNARRWYYWAWGGTWVTGIAAWLSYQTYLSYDGIYQNNENEKDKGNPGINLGDKFINDYTKMSSARNIALIAMGVAIAHEIFHIGRYLYISNKGTTPIVKTSKSAQESKQESKNEIY
jgi:hypothetical protein